MPITNPVLYEQQGRVIKRLVKHTAGTALVKGVAMCYDRDYGTATAVDEYRDKIVLVPGTTNNGSFAGVTARSYKAKTGGRMIEIYEPGSVCFALIADGSITIGDRSFVTFIVGGASNGKFTAAAAAPVGIGSAKVLQTLAATGLGLVELLATGDQTGGVETSTSVAAGGAITPMVGGKTIVTGVALTGADITATLADGTYIGQRKVFYVAADLGDAYDFILTTTTCVQLDGSTGLSNVTMDDIGDYCMFEWMGLTWKLIANAGGALA